MAINLPNSWGFFDPLALDVEEIRITCKIDTAHAISEKQSEFRDLQRELRGWGSYGCQTSFDMKRVSTEIFYVRTEMIKIENKLQKLEKDAKRYAGDD